jgi:hypothetical protein
VSLFDADVLLKRSGFAINKVIHHDDVILPVIVRTRGGVAVVIRTLPIRASLNLTPKKDRFPSPGVAGT